MSRDSALRPHDWDTYIGQEKLKSRLRVSIEGAKARSTLMDHVLLHGPPGVGKTSLAALIAQEMETNFHSMVMPIKPKALMKTFLESDGVIFLDEIHRLKTKDQENLLPILEDRKIQFDNGKTFNLVQPFMVVAATTELRRVIRPLRDRFTHRPKFDEYSDEDMAEIIELMARRLGVMIPWEEALALGKASAGIPRQARTLVLTARDLGTCDPEVVLTTCGITADGLTEEHLAYLSALNSMGDKAGVDLISNYLGLPKDVIIELEQLLLRKRFIEYSPKGRQLMMAGMKVINDPFNKEN